MLTLKYRLHPNSAQETALNGMLATARDVYNSLVNWRKHDYDVHGKSPNYCEQANALPLWKKEHPELRQVYSQVLQDVVKRVDRAFDAFFRRVKAGEAPGYPRLKGKGQYDSLTYPQEGGFAVGRNALRLSKVGCLQAVVHRPLPGKAKTCTVRLQAGKWFAYITCEVEAETLPPSSEQVGIDVGLNVFAATSAGEFIENPRFFRKDEKALAKAQRKADKFKHARTQGQKAARRKAKKVVSRIHERVRNRRHDFVHQLSRQLVNRYGLIAVEALSVDNMVQRPAPKPDLQNEGQFLPNRASAKSGLNKSIIDAAWSVPPCPHVQGCKSRASGSERGSCVYEPGLLRVWAARSQNVVRTCPCLPVLSSCPRPGRERGKEHSSNRCGATQRSGLTGEKPRRSRLGSCHKLAAVSRLAITIAHRSRCES